MDYEKVISEMKTAWDALEEFPVKGFSSRARIQLAQEMILSVYNEAVKAKNAAEKEDDQITEEIPEE